MIGNGNSVGPSLGAGRPAIPEDSLEKVFDWYVTYRGALRKNRKTHRPKASYVATTQHSDTWMRKYWKNNHLWWPLLPEDDTVLVAIIFGQPDYWITWANDSLCHALDYTPSALVDTSSALTLLRGDSAHLNTHELGCIDELRDHPGEAIVLDRTWLITREGLHLPVKLEVRYTGAIQDRFVAFAEVLGAAYTPHAASDETNTYDQSVVKWSPITTQTQYPQLHLLPGTADRVRVVYDAVTIEDISIRDLYDRSLAPYQFPSIPDEPTE